uniref:Zinc finger protein 280D n=1 Tax=Gallus gallus TaxID=9031 RepID=A0A8V0ZV05_CHICK
PARPPSFPRRRLRWGAAVRRCEAASPARLLPSPPAGPAARSGAARRGSSGRGARKQGLDSSEETKEGNRNQNEVASVEKNEENSSLSDTENVPNLELPDNSTKKSLHGKGTRCDSDHHKQLVGEKQKCIHGESELKTCQSSDYVVLTDQTKVQNLDKTTLSAMNARDLKLTLGEDVSFEQFLRKRNEPESVNSDMSEQGSIHLEPLTPSEVLEHEATEILQKGNIAPSSKQAEQLSEQTDKTSQEGSPSRMETTVNKTDENEAS